MKACLLFMVMALLLPSWAVADAPEPGRDLLLVGTATNQQAPVRPCTPERERNLLPAVEIPAPPGGWPGAPQAVDVFNIFSGEVLISHGDREVCGHMQDARTRDSRFRAGIGMVVVPEAGDVEPIRVAWEEPLQARWIPTVRLGAPSPVQQNDTLRLVIRTACIAIALALGLSAVIGFVTTRGREFLGYIVACLLLVVWQAVLSGLSGYPEPWLPVGADAPAWLTATSAMNLAVISWMLWWLCGGRDLLWGSRRWLLAAVALLCLLAAMTPLLPLAWLSLMSTGLDHGLDVVCAIAVLLAIWSLRRGDRHAVDGLVAVVPLLLLVMLDLVGYPLLVQYRVEANQLAVTGFLIIAAYPLNRSVGHLRRQRDEMRRLADTDMLTGLPNRRAGLRQLERYFEQARASGQPLSIGFLDIDLFKQINDRYGHDVGDDVLVSVARTLESGVRSREDVIRMGGEEFLILLPGTSIDLALPRLEQLRQRVTRQAQELEHAGLVVTVSIGLAELQADDADTPELLRRADNAMYRAKREGRDRVVAPAQDIEIA